MKYLLSTGKATDRLEYYVMDLFRLYLSIQPRDIPGSPQIGFNFTLSGTFKSDLVSAVESKVKELVSVISGRFNSNSIVIEIESLEIVDETLAKLVVSVNKLTSDEILINLYE